MKSTLALIVMILCLSCESKSDKKVISIIENKPLEWPKDSPASHNDKDVLIYKIPSPSDTINTKGAYLLVAYNKKKDKIVGHKDFVIESENVYNKAEYQWANDTTLNFRLYNTSNNLFENFSYEMHMDNSSSLKRGLATSDSQVPEK